MHRYKFMYSNVCMCIYIYIYVHLYRFYKIINRVYNCEIGVPYLAELMADWCCRYRVAIGSPWFSGKCRSKLYLVNPIKASWRGLYYCSKEGTLW